MAMKEIRSLDELLDMIGEAAKEDLLDLKNYGPPQPLNEAAQAEQQRHIVRSAEIEQQVADLEAALDAARGQLRTECIRWARTMKTVQPEIFAAGDNRARISDDMKHYHIRLKRPLGEEDVIRH